MPATDTTALVLPPEIVLRRPSPGYTTTPPAIQNDHLIPAEIHAMMAPTWATPAFGPRDIIFTRLNDVFVIGEGLVFTSDQVLIAASRTQYTDPEIAGFAALLRQAMTAGTVIQDHGTTLLAQKRGMFNHGHWLIELLPIAYLALAQLRRGDWTVLAPAGPASILESLAMIGVPNSAIRQSDGHPRHCPELILVQGLTDHGVYISPLVMECMDSLMRGIEPGKPASLWVSRAGLDRSLQDEHQVEAALAAKGWTILHPGRMSLYDQVAAFKGATHVAGVLGAGLTGIVFASPGTPLTGFAPAAMPDTFFWTLCTLRGQSYRDIRCSHETSRVGPAPWDSALRLPLSEILATLDHPS